jgi:hypothetical protein
VRFTRGNTKAEAVLVYLKRDINSTDINNMNFSSFTPDRFSL